MGDVSARLAYRGGFSVASEVFLAGFALARADDPAPIWHRAASPGAAIGVPACPAQITYLHIIGR